MFGLGDRADSLPRIEQPPADAVWHEAHPKGEERVRAWIATEDSEVMTKNGVLKARKGEDVLVAYGPRDVAVVRRDLFERTYKRVANGVFKKRTDVSVRYFVLDHPAIVKTIEGEQRARTGDWVVQGLDGELWPVSREAAKRKYRKH